MKIGLVLDDTLDTPDGVQQYVLEIGAWMTNQGHEVHYLVGQTTRSDIPNVHSLSRNVRVKFNGNRMSMPLPASRRKLRQLLTHEQFDILHVQVPYSPFMAGLLLRLAPARTVVVGTFHILPYSAIERFANRALAFMTHRSSRRFVVMIAASQPAADFAKQCYGFTAKVIPHPFDYSRFAVDPAPMLGVTNIVYLSRLVERKGALWLLRAIAELKRRGKLPENVRIEIGGRGPLLAKLQKYVAETGLSHCVAFRGFIAEADKPAFLAQADIAVFPSTSGESFGISIIEGLAAARGVVIAGDNPGYRAAMQLDGQLLNPKNTPVFADTLEYWLTHAAKRNAAAAIQKKIAVQYDRNIVGHKVMRLYNQALHTRHIS